MPVKRSIKRMTQASLLSLTLGGCFHIPYNHYQKPPPPINRSIAGSGVGIAAGALIGGTAVGGIIGGGIGASIGALADFNHASIQATLRDLQRNDIQFIHYGDTNVLIVPTDHYYEFNSPKLNDLCFDGLNNIIKLLQLYHCSTVYVAGFTDNIGSREHKQKLSQARAESMLTFLWANNISARRLKAEGYGDKFAIGDNHLIRGSAYNRRIEIQWQNAVPVENQKKSSDYHGMK